MARAKRQSFPRSILPNILVYIDVREGRPTRPSLFAVSEARRIARMAGASIFAVVVTPPLATADLDALARPIAAAGADKLLLCEAGDFAGPPQDATHGRGLDAAAARVAPLLVLFPAGGCGAALGPTLAARLGGPFAPWCDFLTTETDLPATRGASRVQLIRCRPDGRSRRRLDPGDIERPIVAVLGAGGCGGAGGRIQDLEIEVVASIKPAEGPVVNMVERAAVDPHAHLPLASVLVLIGDGEDGLPLIPADALNVDPTAGEAIAYARDVPAAVLASCCPDVLLKLGASDVRTARSPRTRVILATAAAGSSAQVTHDVEEVDVLWQFRSPGELTAAAVAELIGQMRSRTQRPGDQP